MQEKITIIMLCAVLVAFLVSGNIIHIGIINSIINALTLIIMEMDLAK